MIKKYIPYFLFLFSTTSAFSQRSYEFDYFSEYEHKHGKTSKPYSYFVFTNSKDNSYTLTVWDKDAKHFYIEFIDEKGIFSKSSIPKEDFFEVEAIGIKCPLVQKYSNRYKDEQTENFEFVSFNDTIINTQPYKHFSLRPVDAKKAKRKDWGTTHYIIQKATEFHLPNFYPGSPAYEEWKLVKNIPNGLIKDFYTILLSGEKVEGTVLLQYAKLRKIIVFDEGCDYTRKK